MTSRNPTISLQLAGDPAARLTILDRDEMWATPEQEQLALPVSALGFWVALRSLPQSVEMREDALCSRLGMTRYTLHKLAQTLEDHGRLDRESERDGRGQFTLSVWTMHFEPLPLDLRSRRVRKRASEAIHACDSPSTEKSYMEKKSPVVVVVVNINKCTTTTTTTNTAVATKAAGIIMPRRGLFDEAQQDTFRGMLAKSQLPNAGQQQLLDELVYAVRKGAVRKHTAYLAGLIDRSRAGQYNPDGALIVARERNEGNIAEVAKVTVENQAAERRARRVNPAAQARIQAAFAEACASHGRLLVPRLSEADEPENPVEPNLDSAVIPNS